MTTEIELSFADSEFDGAMVDITLHGDDDSSDADDDDVHSFQASNGGGDIDVKA